MPGCSCTPSNTIPHLLLPTPSYTIPHPAAPVFPAAVGHHEAIHRGTALVGAVGATKLLDGTVCRPGQLQGDVEAAARVGHTVLSSVNKANHICCTTP